MTDSATINLRHICTAGMVAHHDLLTAHEQLENGTNDIGLRLLLMRHLMLEIANITDLATKSGILYKKYPELGILHKEADKGLNFCKYIRNIYVGHFVENLTDKTFEWKPETYVLLGRDDIKSQWAVSWFALETAINTYASEQHGHKLFSSDTDLNYPQDLTRFLNFLGKSATAAIKYVSKLIAIARAEIEVPDVMENIEEHFAKAGETDFAIITKGRR